MMFVVTLPLHRQCLFLFYSCSCNKGNKKNWNVTDRKNRNLREAVLMYIMIFIENFVSVKGLKKGAYLYLYLDLLLDK